MCGTSEGAHEPRDDGQNAGEVAVCDPTSERDYRWDWFIEMVKPRLKRLLELSFLIIFDFIIFCLAILVLRLAIAVTEWLFFEKTLVTDIAQVVSHVAVICGYGLYTVFDLIDYIRTLRKEAN